MKLKIYQLGISKVYLKGHPKMGRPTHFKDKIEMGLQHVGLYTWVNEPGIRHGKIHTCRPHYEYWKGIEEKVNSGYGVLSLRQWDGAPYNSRRPEFMRLSKMRVDHLVIVTQGFGKGSAAVSLYINDVDHSSKLDQFAVNDGLENGLDLIHWLGWDGFDGALISFTGFQY